ncbi:hypothetical protein IV73_GL000537 [Weissella kandleri]|uniref:Ferredoxin--NADP reductase n=2 Tax=Weissella kandleri TaxID=1616 RepID=A0A0R2JKT1_9LACO|nr:hypothetical protein IV73_GL000537 [Weissella kandleri]
MMKTRQMDLVIIGAGPVGLFAAYYAGLRELNTVVIESLSVVGGQPQNLYPYKEILDVPGLFGISGDALVENLEQQRTQLNSHLQLATTVIDVQASLDHVTVVTDQQETIEAQAVIVATGKGAFQPRYLPETLAQPSVSGGIDYVLTDLDKYHQRDVLVLGGGDTAVDLANQLTKTAAHVTLVHRRQQFRALEHAVQQLSSNGVSVMTPYAVEAIEQNSEQKLVAAVHEVHGTKTQTLVADYILPSYGFRSDNRVVEQWTIQPALARQKMLVNQQLRTSIPRVFAIGDAAEYENKAELIATGLGEAPIAINTIINDYFPTARGIVHSSSLQIRDGQLQ